MSALDFIQHLQDSQLITQQIADKLRKQIDESPKRISTRSVAKTLVKKGYIEKETIQTAIEAFKKSKLADEEDLQVVDDSEEEELTVVEDVEDTVAEVVEEVSDLVDVKKDLDASKTSPASEAPSDDPAADLFHEGLSDSLDDDSHIDDTLAVATTKTPKRKRKRYTSNRWDSPLMMVGGGGLLLLLFVGGGIWWYLTRGTAEESYNMAHDDYKNESYQLAIEKLNKFVKDYPDAEQTSIAKVQIVTASIWNDIKRQNWESALDKVKKDLPTVQGEIDFGKLRPELASILPNIMEGFANKANASATITDSEAQLVLAHETLEQINNSAFLPTSQRKGVQNRLDKIDEIVKSVERRINRDKELESQVAEMKSVLDNGDTEGAYAIRHQLLRKYPELEQNELLHATVLEITQKELESIVTANSLPKEETTDHPQYADLNVVVAANLTKTPAKNAKGYTIFVLVRGSVYGLDAETGKVVWRRFVGFDSTIQPMPTSHEPNRDAIVVDAGRNELIRLEGKTGNLIWRLPCPGPIASPVLHGKQLIVGCGNEEQQGLLLSVDLATGAPQHGIIFPKQLTSSALVDAQKGIIFQPGVHSSLFLISSSDFQCSDVIYVGHGRQTVVVPPLSIMSHIIIAENPAPNFSLLHVFGPDAENEGRLAKVTSIRLDGKVVTPMTSFGKRFLVSTDRGSVDVFEVDARNPKEPVKRAVKGLAASAKVRSLYPYFKNGRLWVAKRQLTRYDLQTARGNFSQSWIKYQDNAFLAPMQSIANVLIHARQRKDRLGATITGISIGDGNNDGEELWSTDVGVPPAGNPFIEKETSTLNVVTGNGALFSLNAADLRKPLVNTPKFVLQDPNLKSLFHSVAIPNGKRVYFGDKNIQSMTVYDASESRPLRLVDLNIDGQLTCSPVLLGSNILMPTNDGSVYLIDSKTGKPAAHEFQPSLESGTQIAWTQPAVDASSQVAYLTDGKTRIFQIKSLAAPQPHLEAERQAELDLQITGQLTLCGETIYGCQAAAGTDEVVAINTSDLTSSPNKWPLGGKCAFGPTLVGDAVVITSESNQMLCLDSAQNERWTYEMQNGSLSGPPILVDDKIVFATITGAVVSLDANSGEFIAKEDIGKPLGTGPVRFNSKLIVLGSDSAIYVLGIPTK